MFGQLRAHIEKRISISDEEFDLFCSMLEVKHLRKKSTFARAGDICRFQAYINIGCMKTYYTDTKMREHVIQIGFEDWWAADLKSFITNQPADFTIEALEDSEIFTLDRIAHEKLMRTLPSFEHFFRLLLQRGYVSLQQRFVGHVSRSAEDRYLTLIKHFPSMEKRIPQHTIASYLGITPEALSRIRKTQIERQRGKNS
ncbi:MAG: Crp/Fnr family transcriptional regulator [Crocinitomicaceae bacterium]|nr:Crp/Fnr family transcriptional regulator [Crocinitomicaceae bacterium]